MAWDAMLSMTGIKLELISDVDKYNFVEKGIRGGISFIGKRYSKANNPMVPNFDEKNPTTFVTYLDANNLYGWAMCKPLPTGNFEWVELTSLPQLSEGKGMILEVDLEYSAELHDHHNDYPLAPQSLKIECDWQSDYCKAVRDKHNIPTRVVPKLVTTLCNKTKYVLHYDNLVLYLSLGMKLTKIHRALSFNQSQWFKPYVDFNTHKRKEAKSRGDKFGNVFFKLMNNSVFGKTMENIRKRVDVRLVTSEQQMMKI